MSDESISEKYRLLSHISADFWLDQIFGSNLVHEAVKETGDMYRDLLSCLLDKEADSTPPFSEADIGRPVTFLFVRGYGEQWWVNGVAERVESRGSDNRIWPVLVVRYEDTWEDHAERTWTMKPKDFRDGLVRFI